MPQKFFQISADFNLTKKPSWIDNFRAKYDLPYDFHITLKTTTYLNKDNEAELHEDIRSICNSFSPFDVMFSELCISEAPSGWCIMIKAEDNQTLLQLQKLVSHTLSKYGNHISKEKREFETDFKPHITIARHLNDKRLMDAKMEMGNDYNCVAMIESLSLTIVDKDNFPQWSNDANRTIYKFTT